MEYESGRQSTKKRNREEKNVLCVGGDLGERVTRHITSVLQRGGQSVSRWV